MTSQANVSTQSTELAPSARLSVWHWLRTQLFSSPFNTLLTILSVWLLFATVPAMVDWFLISSTATAKTSQECREVTGACWSMIVEKHRLILFGVYPYEEQWRPLLATLILVGVIILSGVRRFWNISLLSIYIWQYIYKRNCYRFPIYFTNMEIVNKLVTM